MIRRGAVRVKEGENVGGCRRWGRPVLVAVAILALGLASCSKLEIPVPSDQPLPPMPVSLSYERPIALKGGDWLTPAWNPTGDSLAAVRMEGKSAQLWLVPIDGTPPSRLTQGPGARRLGVGRVWNSKGLLYSSDETGQRLVWLLGSKSMAPELVGWAGGENADPSWSPDGSAIILARRPYGSDSWGLWMARGDRLIHLTFSMDTAGDVRAPAWSPDGSKILFQFGREDAWNLFTADASDLPTGPVAGAAGAQEQPPGAFRLREASATATASASSKAAKGSTGRASSRAPKTGRAKVGAGKSPTSTPNAVPEPPKPTLGEVTVKVTPFIVGGGQKTDPSWVDSGPDALFSYASTSTAEPDLYAFWEGTVIRLSADGAGGYRSASTSPDGKRIAFSRGLAGRRRLFLVDLVAAPVAR
jgi:hypothetical protein